MLSILGAGCAYPATIIDNQFLGSLGQGLSAEAIFEQFGVERRRSCLPLEYLKETKNQDRSKAAGAALETPTELAVRACRMALARAGITPDQLGLVLGDGCSALQTVPAEGQRVAGALGLKVPAYDANSGGVGLPFFMNMLSKWQPEAVPEYVLCFSTNATTSAVNYNDLGAGACFGDGAGAAVISLRHQGKLRLEAAFWENDLNAESIIRLPLTEHLEVRLEGVAALQDQRVEKIRAGVDRRSCGRGAEAKVAAVRVSPLWRAGMEGKGGISGVEPWPGVRNYGEILGSAAFCVLAESWDELNLNENLCVIVPGVGLGFGGVLFSPDAISHQEKVGS